MKKKTLVLIKTNLADIEPRLVKEIQTLNQDGYSVILLCWDRERKTPSPGDGGIDQNYREIRFRLRAPWGPRILILLPFWWTFVAYHLLTLNWDIVHPINLDCVLPAIVISKLKRKRAIYEMYDTLEDSISLPEIIRATCLQIDKFIMRLANGIIIVDESRIKEFDGIPNRNISIIYNSPPDVVRPSVAEGRKDIFTIFYAGLLKKGRSIENVIAAVKDLEGVRLIIAGFGDQEKEIREEVSKNPHKITFLGSIPHSEVLNQTFSSELLFSLYDPKVRLYRFSSSNKLFEAMMCGKPILVSKRSSMDEIVEREKCGLPVECDNISDIRNSIARLKDNPGFCAQLGRNGRLAYETKYDWKIMQQRLLKFYLTIS